MNAVTRLITLGTSGGPPPRAHRAQSSNLLTVNGTHYVVDAGDGVARRLAKAGINVREIGIVFITHHHDDHTAGLGRCCRFVGSKSHQADPCLRPAQNRRAREGRCAVLQD